MDAGLDAGLQASGLTQLSSVLHVPLAVGTAPEFFRHLGPLSDVIPIPVPLVQNVASVGDLFISAGLAFFLFATVMRAPDELEQSIVEARLGRVTGTRVAWPAVEIDEDGYAILPRPASRRPSRRRWRSSGRR